jgi:hypothetical protein
MNQYLYPWHDLEGNNQIGQIHARNYTECEEKLTQQLLDKYEDLDDTLEFEDLLNQLGETYGVFIGDIYDITEF